VIAKRLPRGRPVRGSGAGRANLGAMTPRRQGHDRDDPRPQGQRRAHGGADRLRRRVRPSRG
jgi:hypothetical protein